MTMLTCCGCRINDNAALGRDTTSIPGVESEELETKPMLVQGLQDEDFKAIRVAAGDSVSLAISDRGELRAWGSFRVSLSRPLSRMDPHTSHLLPGQRGTPWI